MSAPHHPDWSEGHDITLAENNAVLAALLQRHSAAMRARTVIGAVGRSLSVALAILIALPGTLSVVQVLAGALIVCVLGGIWFGESRRLSQQIVGLEKTLARHTGGTAEDLYIESGYYFLRVRFGFVSFLEPIAWTVVNLTLLIVSAVINGIIR